MSTSKTSKEADLEAEFRRLCGDTEDTQHLKEQLERQAKELEELRALRERCARQDQELRELRERPEHSRVPHAAVMEVDTPERQMPDWLRNACHTAGVDAADAQKELAGPWSCDNENRSDREFDVNDEMHCLHGRFRCQGQPLPLMEGLPHMDMSQCNCSSTVIAADLIPDLPQPAHSHRVECVLEGARVIAIWQGCGTLAEKVAWIQDPFHRRITPKSVALSYAFFRSRCLHLSVMAGTIPSDGIMRHALISGWSCDITQIFELGWRIATRISWKVAQSAIGQEHRKLLIVVPETLHRLKFAAQGMKDTKVFYYRQFREVHLKKTELFDDNLGKVIVVLPSLEPKPGTWLPLVHAWNMWLQCGCRVFLIAGPRPQDENSWYRVATQARVHMNGFLECHPELVPQVVDKLMVENGVIDPNSPAYAVAVLDDNDAWLPERQVRLFYEYLTRQLAPYLAFESLPVHSQRPRRSVLTGEPSTTSRERGYPAIKEGGISKRVQRRKDQRKRRSEARAAAKALEQMDVGGTNETE